MRLFVPAAPRVLFPLRPVAFFLVLCSLLIFGPSAVDAAKRLPADSGALAVLQSRASGLETESGLSLCCLEVCCPCHPPNVADEESSSPAPNRLLIPLPDDIKKPRSKTVTAALLDEAPWIFPDAVRCKAEAVGFLRILAYPRPASRGPPAGAETQSTALSNDLEAISITRGPSLTAAGGSHLLHFICSTISSASPQRRDHAWYPPAQTANLRRASAVGRTFRNRAD